MDDSVTTKSADLRTYMSNRPDDLVALAKHYGKVEGVMVSAELTNIDTKGMVILCTMQSGEKQSTTVAFKPPLAASSDPIPRLLEMKAIALEQLGIIQAPRITSFEFPSRARAYFPPLMFAVYNISRYFPAISLERLALEILGQMYLKWLVQLSTVVSAFLSLYVLVLCRRHRTGFVVGVLYVISTFLCGKEILRDLKRRIQRARIDSMMKVQ